MELYPFSIQPIKGNNCGLIPDSISSIVQFSVQFLNCLQFYRKLTQVLWLQYSRWQRELVGLLNLHSYIYLFYFVYLCSVYKPYNRLLWWQVANNDDRYGFYVPWRVVYNFRLAKLLEKPSGTLLWMSTFVSVERSYRNKLAIYHSQLKPHLIIMSEDSKKKSQKTIICSGCASLRQSLLYSFIYNKTTIIRLHFCQIWSRSLILLSYWSP